MRPLPTWLPLWVWLACPGCGLPSPVLERPPSFRRGVALGLFTGQADPVVYERHLEEIRAAGATDVSLVITWLQADVTASEVRADPAYTISRSLLERLIRAAHREGLRVMLFPIVRLEHRTPSQWRGVLDPGDRGRWFASYGHRIAELAELGRAERVEAISVGSELVSLEPFADDWRQLITRTRQRFAGKLLYSANWDHYQRVSFWEALDWIGISAYWELAPPGRLPSVDELVVAWRPIQRQLAALALRSGRQVILTEVGYPSVSGASAWPWNDFLTGPDGKADLETQRRLYEAFAYAWARDPTLDGTYFWLWFAAGGMGDPGYTPRGKPAELVLREWYRAPRPMITLSR